MNEGTKKGKKKRRKNDQRKKERNWERKKKRDTEIDSCIGINNQGWI